MNVLLRGSTAQRLRLGAGLVLFTFVATHFFNHALGLVGLEAMDTFQTWRYAVTRSWLGTILLGAAAATHIGLALQRLWQRRTWRLPAWEAAQIATGVLIPFLLVEHVVATRVASSLYGISDFYRPVLGALWPGHALSQSLLLVIAWTHGCIGLHFWLRLAPGYDRAAPWLLSLAVLLPALALAGFMVGGREVAAGLKGVEAARRPGNATEAAAGAHLTRIVSMTLLIFAAALLAILARHVILSAPWRRTPQVTVTFPGAAQVTGPLGSTLLEIGRLGGVPLASVCGGRARCSTCRVRVEAGGEALAPPGEAEAATLKAIAAPKGIRLACQIRPMVPLSVTPLVAPAETARTNRLGDPSEAAGVERTVAVMFLDIRGFTQLSAKRLPYDVVFLLNRLFTAIGDAIEGEGGWIDKYMGDGVLAVFDRDSGAEAGARQALAAAARIDLALERLNGEIEGEVGRRIGVGIGLHAGPLVIGRIGHPASAAVTVIGSTVNVAARLEALSKELGCQLVVSEALARLAGWRPTAFPRQKVAVRGIAETVEVRAVKQARLALGPPAG